MKQYITHLLCAFTVLGASTPTAIASPGHDHGHNQEMVAPAAGPAAPRFEAHSDLFEVVGVLHDDELSVTVDRYATNAPVLGAKVEIESGDIKAVGQFHEDHGDYSFDSKPFTKHGTYPLTIFVSVGAESDLLAGELVVPEQHEKAAREHGLGEWPMWIVIAVIAFIVIAFAIWRFSRTRTRSGVTT